MLHPTLPSSQAPLPCRFQPARRSRFLLAVIAATLAAETVRFDSHQPGHPPPGWSIAMTHHGAPPNWTVVRDDTAPSPHNALAQLSSDATSSRFPLAILDSFQTADGAIRVRFKTLSGDRDQAAGLVWRYRDPDNYYIVRANALEDNVVLYKVHNGVRTALAPKGTPPNTYGVPQSVHSGVWCELSVHFQASLFTVSFNGAPIFQVEDSTFLAPGKTGLWTKADSVISFDDFAYSSGVLP